MKTTEALSRLRGGAANPSTSMPPPTPIPNTAESRVTSPQDLVTKLEEVHKQFEKSHALLEKLPEHREKSREMLEKSRALLENAREQAAVAAAKKDEVALAERKELLTLEKVLPMPGLKPETREILQKRADELKKRLEAAEPPKAK